MDYYISLELQAPTEDITSEQLEENGYFKLEGKNGNTVYGKRVILPKYSSQIPKEDIKFIEEASRDHNILAQHPITYRKYEILQEAFDRMEEKPDLKEKEGTQYWTEALDLNASREVNVYNIVKKQQTKKRKKKNE